MLRAAALALAIGAALSGCAGTQPASNTGSAASQPVSRGEALLLVALLDFQRRNYGNTISAATLALQSGNLDPRRTSVAHQIRGSAYLELRDSGRARDDFNAGINADPTNGNVYLARALLNIAERHVPQARDDLDRSIAAQPNFVAHYLRGLIRLYGRDRNGAREDFDRSIALQPTAHEGYYGRGLLHHLSGQIAQARVDYQKALELRPGFAPAQNALDALNARRPAPVVPPNRPDRPIPL